jgi:hypothetical protein
MQNRFGRGGGRRSNKNQVYNAVWTSDDLRIITLQNVPSDEFAESHLLPTRLKVWDSMTGDILRIIREICPMKCSVLSPHPFNPSVVLTCGSDGKINFWDIELEKELCSIEVSNHESADPTHFEDACFSPDGLRVAVTDIKGRLCLVSLDDPDRKTYGKTHMEQYFSTDYSEVRLDSEGFAIDVSTQLPINIAPKGLLCNFDNTPHDDQPPKKGGPKPLLESEIRKSMNDIKSSLKSIGKLMDRTYMSFLRKNKDGGHARRNYYLMREWERGNITGARTESTKGEYWLDVGGQSRISERFDQQSFLFKLFYVRAST